MKTIELEMEVGKLKHSVQWKNFLNVDVPIYAVWPTKRIKFGGCGLIVAFCAKEKEVEWL